MAAVLPEDAFEVLDREVVSFINETQHIGSYVQLLRTRLRETAGLACSVSLT